MDLRYLTQPQSGNKRASGSSLGGNTGAADGEPGGVVPSDGELVMLARARDSQALAALLARHRAAMHAVAVAQLGSGLEVEDVVQDASLVAIAGLHRLRDPAKARAWLTGITRNLCRERTRVCVPAPVHRHPVTDPSPGPEELLERHALRDWVWSALDALSAPLQNAVLLRYFSSASSYESIAAALDIPVGTVRSRLSAARRMLAAEIRRLAGTAHPGHAELERDRVALVAGITEQYNRGAELDVLSAALARDARLSQAGALGVIIGREPIVRSIGEDITAGVGLRLLSVVAGPYLTVVEAAFANPADDPDHCPPLTTQVMFHDGAGISAMHLHYGRP